MMRSRSSTSNQACHAFTLIELLMCIGVVSLLIGILLPSLAGARTTARAVICQSNQRQLLTAWTLYAGDYRDRAMPLAYWEMIDIATGPQVFWWGAQGSPSTPVDHTKGFIWPYLDGCPARTSVFECPSQQWGTYQPQGGYKQPTSTYGYNGYYLSPAKTPGWGAQIGRRPWQRVSSIPRPSELLVFADTLLGGEFKGDPVRNCALLDPPLLFTGNGGEYPIGAVPDDSEDVLVASLLDSGRWRVNPYPTTAFRHGADRSSGRVAVAAAADSSVRRFPRTLNQGTQANNLIDSIGGLNPSLYIPDARDWR